MQQRPGYSSRRRPVLSIGMAVILVFVSVIGYVDASDRPLNQYRYSSGIDKRVAEANYGGILIDKSPPPVVPAVYMDRRQLLTSSSSATLVPTTTANSSSTSGTASATIPTATASYTGASLPLPFDRSLNNNFTSSCPKFFQEFLNNSTFRQCAPVSLLIQNSYSWIEAVRSDGPEDVLDHTLDNSCAASLALCSPLMASIAAGLIADGNCGVDYQRQNPVVTQAYAGLLAYEPIYQATCLKDNTTQGYCFAEALRDVVNNTNTNAPRGSDAFPYYTAIGLSLPNTTAPACTECLKETMRIYAGYAQVSGQPLAATYLGAARQINAVCGNGFANSNVQVAAAVVPTGAASSASVSHRMLSILSVVLAWSFLAL